MTSVPVHIDLHRPAVLKQDASARVEFVPSLQGGTLRKTYFPRGVRILQTFLVRSRAEREHANLSRLGAAGVPCVPTLGWRARRAFGLVWSSSLETGWVGDAQDLRSVLREGVGAARKRRLASAYGALLRQVHATGCCSTTLSPRNVLVRGVANLMVCDQPHMVVSRRGVLGRWLADIDLFDAFFSTLRLREWSDRERYLGLCGYTDGDREAAARLWRRLARRSRRAHRLHKGLARLLQRVL